MDGVGDERFKLLAKAALGSLALLALAVEDITAESLADRHAQIDVQANSGDAHARILLVLRHEVRIVVVMVVPVGVSGVFPGLRARGAHGGRGTVSYAVGGGGPIERRGSRRHSAFCSGAEDAQLPGSGRVPGLGAVQDVRS